MPTESTESTYFSGSLWEINIAVVAIEVTVRSMEEPGGRIIQHAQAMMIDLVFDLLGPIDVIADEQVEVAVVVVIEKARRRRPAVRLAGHARLDRHILELAVP